LRLAAGLAPVCSLALVVALAGAWRIVPQPQPSANTVRAWVPFRFTDSANGGPSETLICVSNRGNLALFPPLLQVIAQPSPAPTYAPSARVQGGGYAP
jgi:hypothetical protein